MSKTSGVAHYAGPKFEVIDVIEAFDLPRNLANTAKYILRCGKKGPRSLDLEKAIDYLWRERYGTWAELPERTPERKGNE